MARPFGVEPYVPCKKPPIRPPNEETARSQGRGRSVAPPACQVLRRGSEGCDDEEPTPEPFGDPDAFEEAYTELLRVLLGIEDRLVRQGVLNDRVR